MFLCELRVLEMMVRQLVVVGCGCRGLRKASTVAVTRLQPSVRTRSDLALAVDTKEKVCSNIK
jgi:hypothetical protein